MNKSCGLKEYVRLLCFYFNLQVKELRKIVGADIVLCIAGNKCDMEKQRQVPETEAEQYAESVGAFHQKVLSIF